MSFIYIKKKKVNLPTKLMHRKLLPDSCDHIFSYLIYKYNKHGASDQNTLPSLQMAFLSPRNRNRPIRNI